MPELHSFLKQHPEKKEKFDAMLDVALGASKYKLFIKRKLQNLAESGNSNSSAACKSIFLRSSLATRELMRLASSPLVAATGENKPAESSTVNTLPPISKPTPTNEAVQPTAVPQPVIPADADDDTKLAMYKDKLKYYALGSASGDSIASG